MEIILYNNKSDMDHAFKDLERITTKEATVYDYQDVVNPTFLFNDSIDIPLNVNYVYAPAYGRYYSARPELLGDGNYALHCQVDALSSFIDDLAIVPCIIDREDPHNDLYVDGGTFVKGTKNYGTVYNFSGGFNSSPENILICCGGVV